MNKPLSDFYKNKNRKSGYNSFCKVCANDSSRLSRIKRRKIDPKFVVKERENSKVWIKNNREKHKELNRKNYLKVRHTEDYLSKARFKEAKRRSAKLNATPAWLSVKQENDIKLVYKVCSKISKKTGKPHEVDHIVPLMGENVCGLHVPWNLQILPASMNRSKGNAYPFNNTTS